MWPITEYDAALKAQVDALEADSGICAVGLDPEKSPLFGHLEGGRVVAWLWGTTTDVGNCDVAVHQDVRGEGRSAALLAEYISRYDAVVSSFELDVINPLLHSPLTRLGFSPGAGSTWVRPSAAGTP